MQGKCVMEISQVEEITLECFEAQLVTLAREWSMSPEHISRNDVFWRMCSLGTSKAHQRGDYPRVLSILEAQIEILLSENKSKQAHELCAYYVFFYYNMPFENELEQQLGGERELYFSEIRWLISRLGAIAPLQTAMTQLSTGLLQSVHGCLSPMQSLSRFRKDIRREVRHFASRIKFDGSKSDSLTLRSLSQLTGLTVFAKPKAPYLEEKMNCDCIFGCGYCGDVNLQVAGAQKDSSRVSCASCGSDFLNYRQLGIICKAACLIASNDLPLRPV